MDPDNSRRSACDRCRGQKLRCVRPPKQANAADGQTLQPCERCTKAGAGCFSTLPPPRKLTRTERLPSPSNSTLISSQKRKIHHTLAANDVNEYQPGFGADSSLSTNGNGSVPTSGLSSTSGSSPTHRRGSSQAPTTGWDKERGFRKLDIVQHEPQKFNDHATIERRRRGLGDIQSPTAGLADTPAFSMNRSPASDPIGISTFDYGIGLVSQPDTMPPDDGTTWMDMLLYQAKGSLATGKDDNLMGKGGNQVLARTDDCLHRLSELSSQLLKDFSRMSSMRFHDLLSSSFYCDPNNAQSLHDSERSMCQENAIGRMLNNSQTFLDTLQHLIPGIPSSSESECSYSEDGDDLAYTRRMVVDSGDPSRLLLGHTRASSNGSPKSFSGTVGVPTVLTVFTCYAWLLQTYDKIFSLLHTALASESQLSLQSLPNVLPGLHVGGFSLDDHQSLQMEMLIHLSTQMLERIEEAFRMNLTSQVKDSRENWMNDHETPVSTFLDTILEPNPLKILEGDQKKGVEGIKQTMERIRRILRGIS
ncbi:uncharacterized protein F4812DRAFT_463466 [Daldinia caldariorum]|uniref:uncharacterized protein n=1 Tax=Daldinia caldariorum TaxID=326644 RepID=UPI002007EB93|nr:uncharacterized protein F4812DRAFT_463466 [Daldinia caldariorum]KAI1463638.1 hypothetical protein F4812DRAFT_463466 [Daldinia caldariorum]